MSCYQYEHLGLLREEMPAAGQQGALLDRFNTIDRLEKQVLKGKSRDTQSEVKAEGFRKEAEKIKEKLYFQKLFQAALDQVELYKDEYQFETALKKYFEHFKEVRFFAVYQMTGDGKTCVSSKNAEKNENPSHHLVSGG